jgi:hypothetical protein
MVRGSDRVVLGHTEAISVHTRQVETARGYSCITSGLDEFGRAGLVLGYSFPEEVHLANKRAALHITSVARLGEE